MLRCIIIFMVFLLNNYDCAPSSINSNDKEAMLNAAPMRDNFNKEVAGRNDDIKVGGEKLWEDGNFIKTVAFAVGIVILLTLIVVLLYKLTIGGNMSEFHWNMLQWRGKCARGVGHVPMVEKRMGRLPSPSNSQASFGEDSVTAEGRKAICSASETSVNECSVKFSDEYECYTISRHDENRA